MSDRVPLFGYHRTELDPLLMRDSLAMEDQATNATERNTNNNNNNNNALSQSQMYIGTQGLLHGAAGGRGGHGGHGGGGGGRARASSPHTDHPRPARSVSVPDGTDMIAPASPGGVIRPRRSLLPGVRMTDEEYLRPTSPTSMDTNNQSGDGATGSSYNNNNNNNSGSEASTSYSADVAAATAAAASTSITFKPTFAQSTEIGANASETSSGDHDFLSGAPSRSWKSTVRAMWGTAKSRAPYYIPSIRWLPRYTLDHFRSDIIAGLTIAVMIVPQGLSYSALADLPTTHGLYCAFVPVLVYTFLGLSRQISVGPEAVIAILTGSALENMGDDDTRVMYAAVLCLLVGLFTFTLGLFRLGFLDSMLSRPLVEGFVLATAVVIMVEQLHGLLGLHVHLDQEASTFSKLQSIAENIDETHGLTCAFGFVALAFLLALHFARKRWPDLQWLRFFPGILLVVIFGTIISWQTNAEENGVHIMGHVNGTFYTPRAPKLTSSTLTDMAGPAALISVVGFVEASAIAKTYSAKYGYQVSPNRELVALGAANLIGSFFGAFPTFASLPRSAINDMAGAKTQMTGVIVAGVVVLTIGTMLPLFVHLPRACMSAIVFSAAVALLHFDQVRFIIRMRAYRDALLLLVTFAVTLSIGVETGLVVGIAVSIVLVIRHTTLPRMTILGGVSGTDKFKPVDSFSHVNSENLLVIKIDEALYFANTGQLKDALRRIEMLGNLEVHPSQEPSVPPVFAVIFDLRDMPSIDASGVQILMEIVVEYRSRGVDVAFVKVRDSSKQYFHRSGFLELVGEDHIFNKATEARRFLLQR
ncbi:hypothetical protein CAOG_01991 [Capsaspora owczarzaki ATCC 30864]|uniref:STAS domain-containing protein n=1 Tax=Capsaspora owczarzaki (strain ATCC 30864) TaxID=595528 RepID=A0A0D2VKY1_CAPO3|nr:hypothetical protein CAOG_01991 [Capsaspora owczarzaki ATCC 30864]KJE90732.1 hypothetical protein CAOG_001991 [Capsaspora owczarzaki ATCC 30864]|eukprot:XP_004364859.1 hypothetical protein CAOG_01991 [Capsaspora owczarzaki ATCC 30864]